jgi:rhodanese-related sulfurtransferase
MKQLLFTIFSLLPGLVLFAQYKSDNVLYKTVFPQDLCKELERNKDFLLLDVRSEGEYHDTSLSTGLNIGHLNNAVNIDVRQVGKRLNEIASYKDKPVFVYCSHSQRSRRVSKMLADSGFTHVNNINGGMTAIHLLDEEQMNCLNNMLSTHNSYNTISQVALCKKLSSSGKNIYLLDVRTDSGWNHVTTNPKFNAYGYLKGSQHIALDALASQLSVLPKDKEIIITDINGADAAKAARMLKENGFEKVSVLIEGIDRWLYSDKTGWACAKDLYVPAVSYNIVSSPEFGKFQSSATNYLILDVRSAEEFANKHTETFRNIGHLKNAVSIPSADLDQHLAEIEKYKTAPVIVYAFSGSPEAYAAANTLTQNGFKDVRVLAGGLFNIRWTASNVEGMAYLHNLVENVPEENK